MGKKKGGSSAAPVLRKEDWQLDDEDLAGEYVPEVRIVDKWDFSKVKNNIEDVLCEEFFDLRPEYVQDHGITDFKLGLAGLACLIALFVCVYGYYVPHPDANAVIGPCTILYFVIMAIYTVHALSYDSHEVILAKKRDGSEVAVSLFWERYNPEVQVEIRQCNSGCDPVQHECKAYVGNFVFEDGEISRSAIRSFVKGLLRATSSAKKKKDE